MKKALLSVLILAGCSNSFDATSNTLTVGTCYHTDGDVGGTPDIIFCVHATGKDGLLRCQGSTSVVTGEFRWYACGRAEKYRWIRDAVVVECPSTCTGNEK